MMTDKGLDEEPEIISSSESSHEDKPSGKASDSDEEQSPIYGEEHDQATGFTSIISSEIYVVDVDGDVLFYSKNLGHARRQAYKLVQNIMFAQPSWYTYHIDQPDHNTFVLSGVNKCCLVSYDTPISKVSVRPLYRVRENRW